MAKTFFFIPYHTFPGAVWAITEAFMLLTFLCFAIIYIICDARYFRSFHPLDKERIREEDIEAFIASSCIFSGQLVTRTNNARWILVMLSIICSIAVGCNFSLIGAITLPIITFILVTVITQIEYSIFFIFEPIIFAFRRTRKEMMLYKEMEEQEKERMKKEEVIDIDEDSIVEAFVEANKER